MQKILIAEDDALAVFIKQILPEGKVPPGLDCLS